MQTHHTTLRLNTHLLHLITFDATTFADSDLLWLPHHLRLQHAGRKRKAEHLAGRIAAVHALHEHNINTVPGIGDRAEPLWPAGLYGSISHCSNRALAVIAPTPVGVDIEALFSPETCNEVVDSIITPAERSLLTHSGLPFSLALTLAFSAKESVYKAYSYAAFPFPGFHSAQVTALNSTGITLRLTNEFSDKLAGICVDLAWIMQNDLIITLLTVPRSGS
ncbi:enterobactin synthase subunit EntD [Phytobacter sp. V91]|uniref:enterobactin synthase subunit EntD n=1 Tax=Phytobacter sp. V91 TaxID=3369425 RepID=UPI003F6034CE